MCEFCHSHGEGKTWYLRAENYSDDFISDLRRREFVRDFFEGLPVRSRGWEKQMRALDRAPRFVRAAIRGFLLKRQKANHFGQVVPIEDIEKIFGFVTSIVRLPCACRHSLIGGEHRYCYGVSVGPGGGRWIDFVRGLDIGYLTGPDTRGLEALTPAEALDSLREHEREGLCHTVWTFQAPFIGGICNCDSVDCLSLKFTLKERYPTLFRAEFVARVDPGLCGGCRQCLRLCPFGAMNYSPARGKAEVDIRRCYGCGICRSACAKNAISLASRASSPLVGDTWL